jgi:hypothetical protein
VRARKIVIVGRTSKKKRRDCNDGYDNDYDRRRGDRDDYDYN